MSRFADPAATRRVEFGECLCPGAPHQSDYADIKAEAGYREVKAFIGAQELDDDGRVADAVLMFVSGWNLLGSNGQPYPPSPDALMALKLPTLTALITAIGDVIDESTTLPNASGAPSVASSRASASRTRTTTRTRTT